MPKYPHVKVQLTGEDGNAFSILARCDGEMDGGGVPDDQMLAFRREATSGDYNHLLQTCMRWFDCS